MSLPESLSTAVIPEPVLSVCQRLTERQFRAFLVGGCVRDILRGKAPKDWDVATSATPEQVQRSFDKVIPTGLQHGTVTVVTSGTHVEVTTFRTEGVYLDGRRPTAVTFKTDIKDDLSRRDFTINAMAFDPVSKQLEDPFDGRQHLALKIIRAVGDPLDRFGEDGLRALRAVRFAAVLGYAIEEQTLAAIPKTLHVFKKVSAERIHDELLKLLLSDRPEQGLELLLQTGLLAAFLPELADLAQVETDIVPGKPGNLFAFAARSVQLTPAQEELRLAALFAEVARPRTATQTADGVGYPEHERLGGELSRECLTRLKFPNKVIDKVALLVREHGVPVAAPMSDGQVRRFAARVGAQNLQALFTVMSAQRFALGDPRRTRELETFRERMKALLAQKPPLDPKGLALNGSDIMRVLGVGPSPVVGDATRYLMDLVFENPAVNERVQLTDAVRKWAENRGV